MASKKTVTHEQLYGSNRYLKQIPHFAGDHHRSVISTALPKNRCAHDSQTSNTVLPSIDLYGSYSTLPTAAPAGVGRPSNCNRHLKINNRWCGNRNDVCYCLYSVNQATPPMPVCMCGNSYQQYQMPSMQDIHHKPLGNGQCYFGYEHGNHVTDEEDSAFPGLPDREFRLLHRNIPALRRTGVDTTGIRQYFYPDGGWGWIICGVSFLAHILTTGLQLSCGLLLFYAIQHLQNSSAIEWLGALSWSISMLVSPFVVTFCRKKSTRLLAVVGGLVMPLGILFTSFATELGQVVFSYGILLGIGVAMVRESSTIMLGNYFKRRRQFVEMVAMSGEGVGIALFSVILKEGVGKAGWRLGLQIIAALVSISFFMGLLYRPASLYHPQRRAIQHLKNQRKKMRENKLAFTHAEPKPKKYFLLDISSLKSATVKVLLMTSGVAALGIYTPMFSMSLNAAKQGSDIQDLVLLQTFLGMSTALGVVISGALIRRPFRIRTFVVNTQVVSQVFISTVAVAILFLSFVMGFKGLCILSWIYGIGFGGFRYSLKILALERIKLRQFSKAWGLIRGIESIPVLISVPLTSFLNDYSLKYGRAGYYICSAAAAIAGIIIFFISHSNFQQASINRSNVNGTIPTPLSRPAFAHQCKSNYGPPPKTDYIYNGCEYPAPDLLNRSCISLNQVESEHGYRNSYCGRSRLRECFHQTPHEHNRGRGHITEADISRHTSQYNFGQGSVGARMGKRIQKSLSFIQNPYCCDGQWYCNCHTNYQWSFKDPRLDVHQPLLCTCSPSSFMQNSRSRSVPEGLSTMSQQCNCKTAQQSREVIYLPRTSNQSRDSTSVQHNQKEVLVQRMPSSTPRYRQQRSQSLSKPIHFVEQITTSV